MVKNPQLWCIEIAWRQRIWCSQEIQLQSKMFRSISAWNSKSNAPQHMTSMNNLEVASSKCFQTLWHFRSRNNMRQTLNSLKKLARIFTNQIVMMMICRKASILKETKIKTVVKQDLVIKKKKQLRLISQNCHFCEI